MKAYELAWIAAEPFLPVIYGKVRGDVSRLIRQATARPAQVLDVGGRKSPYTVGLQAAITVLDLPRESDVQESLNLGVNESLLAELQRRRSNIATVTLQDMTQTTLPDVSFDGVVCVEVIEHVADYDRFVEQIARVLRPGGWLYMTTPNGDYIKNEPPYYNPDHVRLYQREELDTLLKQYFERVTVVWGAKTGPYRHRGLRSMSPRQPLRMLSTMANNVVSHIESRGLEAQPYRTAHLFATAFKSPSPPELA